MALTENGGHLKTNIAYCNKVGVANTLVPTLKCLPNGLPHHLSNHFILIDIAKREVIKEGSKNILLRAYPIIQKQLYPTSI